ncbi:queuosine precursor transporter [bacterium]|nr:queuosine precursor transporter [bacterium]
MNELLFIFHIGAILLSVHLFSKFERVGLSTIFVLQLLFANLFLLKETSLFGLIVTTTDCYTIGSFLTLNIIRERYGKKASDETILLGLLSILFLPLMAMFLLSYQGPIENAAFSNLYQTLLTPSSRIFLVSLLCMITFQKLDTYLFGKFRSRFSFEKSMLFSLLLCQLLDTFCFTYGALSGILNDLPSIFLFSFFIKAFTITLMTPATKLLTRSAR